MDDQQGQVIEGLRPLLVDIGTLVQDPANARRHDARNLGAIEASLRRFGQRVPIVVRRKDNVVIAGNGRYQAALDLGWEQIAAVFVDDDESTSRAYAITDNKTSDISTWDYRILASQLDELENFDVPLIDLGWTESELEVLGAAEWVPPEVPPLPGNGEAGDGAEDDAGGASAGTEGADGRVPVVFRMKVADAERIHAIEDDVCEAFGVEVLADALAEILESSTAG